MSLINVIFQALADLSVDGDGAKTSHGLDLLKYLPSNLPRSLADLQLLRFNLGLLGIIMGTNSSTASVLIDTVRAILLQSSESPSEPLTVSPFLSLCITLDTLVSPFQDSYLSKITMQFIC